MPLSTLRSPPDEPVGETSVLGRSREEMAERAAERPVVMEPPKGALSGLSARDWLVRYEAWIKTIDAALRKYGAEPLIGRAGLGQESTWLVEGVIREEEITW